MNSLICFNTDLIQVQKDFPLIRGMLNPSHAELSVDGIYLVHTIQPVRISISKPHPVRVAILARNQFTIIKFNSEGDPYIDSFELMIPEYTPTPVIDTLARKTFKQICESNHKHYLMHKLNRATGD